MPSLVIANTSTYRQDTPAHSHVLPYPTGTVAGDVVAIAINTPMANLVYLPPDYKERQQFTYVSSGSACVWLGYRISNGESSVTVELHESQDPEDTPYDKSLSASLFRFNMSAWPGDGFDEVEWYGMSSDYSLPKFGTAVSSIPEPSNYFNIDSIYSETAVPNFYYFFALGRSTYPSDGDDDPDLEGPAISGWTQVADIELEMASDPTDTHSRTIVYGKESSNLTEDVGPLTLPSSDYSNYACRGMVIYYVDTRQNNPEAAIAQGQYLPSLYENQNWFE